MTAPVLNFPALILLEDCGGDLEAYISVVYRKFEKDFVETKPAFTKKVGLKKHPVKNGKEATFWHIVEKGENADTKEEDRVACPRRLERIAWPRCMMEAYAKNDGSVLSWVERRGSEDRIHICPHDFSYLVVVADRGDYALLWTAFPIEQDHQRKKYKKKCEAYQEQLKAAEKKKEEKSNP